MKITSLHIPLKILPLFIIPIQLIASSNAPPPPNIPCNEPMQLIFFDEFNGSRLDKDVWISQSYDHSLKNDTARGPDNLEVKDGQLLLHVRKEARKTSRGTSKWTAANVYTRQTFGPNLYMEARFKAGQCTGVNNAFWLACLTDLNIKGISDRYEIDIVEARKDSRIEDKPGALSGHAHLAWHDWKTMVYAKNSAGKRDHVAQGYAHHFTFDEYHTWGLWLGETEMIVYLDGKEIWRGDQHERYKEQWRTGVGKFKQWFPDKEKEAYGRFGQEDWSYLGGYTGDKLNIIFANVPWAAPWSPLGDEADGTFMAVDYVRVYKPLRLLTRTPWQDSSLGSTPDKALALSASKSRTIPLARPVSFNDQHPSYYSLILRKSRGAEALITWLDADGKSLAHVGVDADNQLFAGLADGRASTCSAWPASTLDKTFFENDRDYLLLIRITPAGENFKPAISLCAFPLDETLPTDEPFFHANITAKGDTSMNNGWHLNQKQDASGQALSVRIENQSPEGTVEAKTFKAGSSFPSVLP